MAQTDNHLVGRLHYASNYYQMASKTSQLLREAAAEIERLREYEVGFWELVDGLGIDPIASGYMECDGSSMPLSECPTAAALLKQRAGGK